MLLRLEAQIDADGWDQPTRLFGIPTPAWAEADLAEHGVDLDRLRDMLATPEGRRALRDAGATGLDDGAVPDDPDGAAATTFVVTQLGETTGQPVETIWGYTAPPHIAAVVLAYEGWQAPTTGPAPSKHPERTEFRSLRMVTRSGHEFALLRARGNDPVPVPAAAQRGILYDLLRRVAGAPDHPPDPDIPCLTPAQYLATHAVTQPLMLLLATAGTPVDYAEMRASGLDPDTLIDMHDMFRDMAEAAQGQSPEALSLFAVELLVQHLTAAAWAATDHGRHGVPKPYARTLRDVSDGRVRLRDLDLERHLEVLRGIGADLTWAQVQGGKHSAPLMPEGFPGDAGWAGERLAGEWVATRAVQLPQIPKLMMIAHSLSVQAAQVIGSLLLNSGWATFDADELAATLARVAEHAANKAAEQTDE
jgi:hypothetical protein